MVYRVAATRIDISYRGMSVPIFYYISILLPSPTVEAFVLWQYVCPCLSLCLYLSVCVGVSACVCVCVSTYF